MIGLDTNILARYYIMMNEYKDVKMERQSLL